MDAEPNKPPPAASRGASRWRPRLGAGSKPIGSIGGFIPVVVLGWTIELIYGLVCLGWPAGLRIFCILWFASGAAFFIGTIGGFLFGIPKAPARPPLAEDRTAPSVPDPDRKRYLDNTNLEEVSDWLTKIIIGLGLVEFRSIIAAFVAAGVSVGTAIDADHRFGGTAIATGSLIIGFATGFLFYYLWARVYLLTRLEGDVATRC